MASFQWPVGPKTDDIWEVIFDKYLTNPVDWENLTAGAPLYFEPLIYRGNRKCAKLLPKVMEILDRKDYLKNQEILKCRRVSRFWKDVVDNCIRVGNPCFERIESIDDTDMDGFGTPHNPDYCWNQIRSKNKSRWTGGDPNLRMLVQTATKIRNGGFPTGTIGPFLLGSFEFDVRDNEDLCLRDRVGYLRTIMMRFGETIHHFRINVPSGESQAVAFGLLQMCGVMMPNLRCLTINVTHGFWDKFDYKAEILSQPLPNMNRLLILKMRGVTGEVAKVILEKYSPQLEKLLIDSCTFAPYLTTPVKLSHITFVQYGRPSQDIDVKTVQLVTLLKSLPNVAVTLNLNWNGGTFEHLVSFLQLRYGMLNNLQSLNLRFASNLRDLKTGTLLSLPNIKKLWMHTKFTTLNSIDFILGLSHTLEELTVSLDSVIGLSEHSTFLEQIKFFEYKEQMYKSNVWRQMPRLRKITIRWRTNNFGRVIRPWNYRHYYRQGSL